MKISSYLIFNGEAEAAAAFYAELTGGRIANLYRYADFPPMPGFEIPEGYGQRVGHCCVEFEGGALSVADTMPSDPREFGNGGHMLTLGCGSVEEAERAFAYLAADARKINCPLGEAFFAKRYGEVVDRYGVLWAVMYEEEA